MRGTFYNLSNLFQGQNDPQRLEDLVFIYTNLHLLSIGNPQYCQAINMWDKGEDKFDSIDNGGIREVTNISLEPKMEILVFTE